MTQEDRISQELSSHRALFFIHPFLEEHPNANLFLVGGAVRDVLLARRIRECDFDFVVQGVDQVSLETWLKKYGEVNLVGQHFGVFKFVPTDSNRTVPYIDIALPRTEAVAEGSLGGYKDFDIQSDPNLPIESDLARRDFTINAMAFDVRNRILIDPFDGQKDLAQRRLRAVGSAEERFREDLSRILRGIRFAVELECDVEEKTDAAMKVLLPALNQQREVEGKLEYVVPRETVGLELAKMLSRNPTKAMGYFQTYGLFQELFPNVHDHLQETQGYLDPLTQTLAGELSVVLTLLLRNLNAESIRQTLTFTGLTGLERGTSYRVEVDKLVFLIGLLQKNLSAQDVAHMRASEFERCFFDTKGMIFLRILECLGKDATAQAIQERREDIEERWLVTHDETIAPLLSGQDVLAQGVAPGPEVRAWLDRVRDLQLDGKLMRREEALHWLEQEKQKSSS